MNRGIFGLGTAAVALFAVLGLSTPTTAQAGVCTFGGGGSGALQGVFNGITVPPPSSVDVANDCLDDSGDSLWQIGGSGGAVGTLIIELAGFAGANTFGIWDAANPSNTVELFDGGKSAGDQFLVSILLDGSVVVNFVDTLVDFAANKFGFYLDATIGNGDPDGFFYSDTSLNVDQVDHMYAYQGTGDTIQIGPFAPGPWGANEYILAWEDLLNGGDGDYTDFVVLVESISPVPEPASLALIGLGLFGLGVANRRRTRKIR